MALIVLDAGIIIAVLDGSDAHHETSRAALERSSEERDRLVLPASAYAEALVGPFRRGEASANLVDALVDTLPIEIQPISREIAWEAARLRGGNSGRLRLPDALVVATAVVLKAEELLTTDHRWPRLAVPVRTV